ncbi:MAG: aminotransferase class I and II [Bacteroidota bacterium]|nr:aminotransferase class I and II [Bacteroidota bacterium]MDP4232030.1 aminotransferase class I and II [Bacteroidota bacterium]MDP4241263.1 aminotransferase class I and II [Bacteroidota bacterium]MDP4286655.1 aminotransferase class I and II [Bacteroidota bacterium]
MLETLRATRYVMPLREGGSLPALVEADDDGIYVLKFRGAGQGKKALIAELICGELGRLLGLPVPRLAMMDLDPILGRNEPDYEIRSLIQSSAGLNLAMDYLPGSISFDSSANNVDPALASAIVWFDAFITNIDRTARNTNMLVWHKKLYLIDHGAALFFHHNWPTAEDKFRSPFAQIKDHVLLRFAHDIRGARKMIAEDEIRRIVGLVPDDWLDSENIFSNIEAHREAYVNYLIHRLASCDIFEEEAIRARASII